MEFSKKKKMSKKSDRSDVNVLSSYKLRVFSKCIKRITVADLLQLHNNITTTQSVRTKTVVDICNASDGQQIYYIYNILNIVNT